MESARSFWLQLPPTLRRVRVQRERTLLYVLTTQLAVQRCSAKWEVSSGVLVVRNPYAEIWDDPPHACTRIGADRSAQPLSFAGCG